VRSANRHRNCPSADLPPRFPCRLTGTIILRIVYGYDVKPGRDEYVDLIEQVNTDLNDIGPGKFMVDIIPARTLRSSRAIVTWF
jgi:hypothetical protein